MPEKVLITRKIPDAGLQLLEGFDITILSESPPERGELLEAVRGAAGIFSTVTETVDAELMDAAGDDLKVVANMAVGYDNVDLGDASERGVIVTNTPEVLNETTADTAFMLLLAAARRLGEAERLLRSGGWEAWGPMQLTGPDVWGKTLGVVGFGRIGQAVARRARGFDMDLVYHDQYQNEEAERELGARYLGLDELLQKSDFVSIHTPLTPETTHLIGAEELGLMQPTAVLVNSSRGPVVDEAALADALKGGSIFAAGLDVYEEEPEVHPKLLGLENVVLAPHIGSASIETRDKMAVLAAENLLDVGAGDGLIAFGALDLVGETGRIVFSDISQDLLDYSRRLAEETDVVDRCEFLLAPADDLSALGDASVDVVTTRSVLIYVKDKRRAFGEFYRVLKPGGRLSIFEPINRFNTVNWSAESGVYMGHDVTPVKDLAVRVQAIYERIQPRETDPMRDFDERDLLAHAETAGFGEVHLEYEANITRDNLYLSADRSWETLLKTSGNPRIPTLEEAMNEALTAREIERFTAHLRPLVERNEGKGMSAHAFLLATK